MSLIYLNFHGVGPTRRQMDRGENHCWLDQDTFEAVLDLVQGQPHLRLSVDDGNASDHDIILPALLRRGLKASFFICSGRLDEATFLSRKQVRELCAHGMTIGSHGAAHVAWRQLSPEQFRTEAADSRRVLEDVCGVSVDTAACPFGVYGRRVLIGLREAGYRVIYTSDGGRSAEHQWLRARTTITRSMSLRDIQNYIQNGSGRLRQSLIDVRKFIKRLRP